MVEPQRGDIIRFRRPTYYHFGIYIGEGRVIHKTGPAGGLSSSPTAAKSNAIVREDSLEDAADGYEWMISNNLDYWLRPCSPGVIVQNARSKLLETGYNVLIDNCEHFVTWCRYGEAYSMQVETFFRIVTAPYRFLENGVLFVRNFIF